jgi:hypothetical protein
MEQQMDKAYNAKVAAARAELKADFLAGAKTAHGTIHPPLGGRVPEEAMEHLDLDSVQALLAEVLAVGSDHLKAQVMQIIERGGEAYATRFADLQVQAEEAAEDAACERFERAQLAAEFHSGYGVTL